nr:sigma-54-dependent Fis family transcriptional regulator [Desulfobulbaceae bacterium]
MEKTVTVLIVDDEVSIVESLTGIVSDEGYAALSAHSGEEALTIIEQEQVDIVLMDIWMPGLDGIETLERIKESHPHLPVIMISGHGNIDTAVQATKLGAFDFIEKPPSYDKIVLSLKNAMLLSQLEKENAILRQQTSSDQEITGSSPKISELKAVIERVAPTDAWVLILGEHGTGKELVAQSLHRKSQRSQKPMIEVNCAAIPEELIESELFGHEKGAFTGANASKRGTFDLANGSTLFLDEIADMSLKTQAKILRILQEQKFERVGGSKTISVDVRVLAATNKNLADEIASGNFREDLYWRLNVVPINTPPLRDRLEDIEELVENFVRLFALKGLPEKVFTKQAIKLMKQHDWPGNVRELRNFIERVVIMSPENEVKPELICQMLSISLDAKQQVAAERTYVTNRPGDSSVAETSDFIERLKKSSFKDAKKEFEKLYFNLVIEENRGNISKTAEKIGMERSHLHKKLKSFETD